MTSFTSIALTLINLLPWLKCVCVCVPPCGTNESKHTYMLVFMVLNLNVVKSGDFPWKRVSECLCECVFMHVFALAQLHSSFETVWIMEWNIIIQRHLNCYTCVVYGNLIPQSTGFSFGVCYVSDNVHPAIVIAELPPTEWSGPRHEAEGFCITLKGVILP